MIYIIILINIILTIWLYKKYVYIPKNQINEIHEIEDMDSALIGYIENEDGNSIDWILAEILELDRKGYIEIEYEREDIDEYEYVIKKVEHTDLSKLKRYELTAYRLLFGDQNFYITMSELEAKILRSMQAEEDINLKSLSIRNEIETELINQNIIDGTAKRKIKLIRNLYIIITLAIIIFMKNLEMKYQMILLIQSILVFYVISKAKTFTTKGKNIHIQIKEYKKRLEDNELLKEKKIMHNLLLEKDFANSIALHIMSEARKEFINDEIVEKKLKKSLQTIAIILYYLIYAIWIFLL